MKHKLILLIISILTGFFGTSISILAQSAQDSQGQAPKDAFEKLLDEKVIGKTYGGNGNRFKLMPGGLISGGVPVSRVEYAPGSKFEWSILDAKRRMIRLKSPAGESFILTISENADIITVNGDQGNIRCDKSLIPE